MAKSMENKHKKGTDSPMFPAASLT